MLNTSGQVVAPVVTVNSIVERARIQNYGRIPLILEQRKQGAGKVLRDHLDSRQETKLVMLVLNLFKPQRFDACNVLHEAFRRPLKVIFGTALIILLEQRQLSDRVFGSLQSSFIP